jgi:hypothetical protein
VNSGMTKITSSISTHGESPLHFIDNADDLHAYQDELVRDGLEQMRASKVVKHEDVVKRLLRNAKRDPTATQKSEIRNDFEARRSTLARRLPH